MKLCPKYAVQIGKGTSKKAVDIPLVRDTAGMRRPREGGTQFQSAQTTQYRKHVYFTIPSNVVRIFPSNPRVTSAYGLEACHIDPSTTPKNPERITSPSVLTYAGCQIEGRAADPKKQGQRFPFISG